jgi:curved DNA-binding protein CbpA|tara:strand:+ start:42 stop:2066 length:2025 start_codon:yes stop_codon:yes gene_type:complete
MASLTATIALSNAETHIRQGDAHAGIAILEEVKQKFQKANAPKARRAENRSAQQIKALSSDPRIALGVGPTATRNEIKKNYRKLALKYHPDKNQFTEDLFKVIQTAYDQIKDQPTPAKAPASRRSRMPQATRGGGTGAHPKPKYQQYYQQPPQRQQYHHQQQQSHYDHRTSGGGPSKPQTHKSHRSRHGGKHRHHRHHRPAAASEKENKNPNHRQSKPSYNKPRRHQSSSSSADKQKAEKQMRDFWTSGGKKFPFKFCREHPEAAAELFANMFRGGDIPTTSADATYAAFKSAFEKRGYGNDYRKKGPSPPPSIFPVQNVRALHGQIKKDSIALMWKAIEGAICYELRFRRTRDKEWSVSSDSLRTSACRKNNLIPGTHYDFCVRAKFGTDGIWGPVSKPCTVRTLSSIPEPCLMRDVVDPAEDSVRVRWNAPQKNGSEITGYELQWRHWGGQTWKTASNLISGTECRKKNLLPGRRYEFRVRAKNALGFGAYAGSVSGVTTKSKVSSSEPLRPEQSKTDIDQREREAKKAAKKRKKAKKAQKVTAAAAAAAAGNPRPPGAQRARPRPSGPPPPSSPQAPAPPAMFNPACPAPSSSVPTYPEVELWYRMTDAAGHEYWWSEASGSVWDGPTWVDRWDDSHNSHYYENRASGHTTWRRPSEFVPIVPGSVTGSKS